MWEKVYTVVLWVVTVGGATFLLGVFSFFGWFSYVRPNLEKLQELFPPSPSRPTAITVGRLLFWIAAVGLALMLAVSLPY